MLASLSDLKTRLGQGSSTAENTLLTSCIVEAQALIEAYCKRVLEYAAAGRTEYFDGGCEELQLQCCPVTTLTSVIGSSE